MDATAPLGSPSTFGPPSDHDPFMPSTTSNTILVTGGSGFIGSHVCDALLGSGRAVRCLDNFATSKRGNLAHLEGRPDFAVLEGDIRSAADCKTAVHGV